MVRCKDELKKEIALFLILTFGLATAVYLEMPEMARVLLMLFPWLMKHLSIFYTALNDSYTWTPGVAAIMTCLLLRRNLRSLGWGPGKVRYLLLSCAIPLIYSVAVYGLAWLSGLGEYNGTIQSDLSRLLIASTAVTLVLALGEEIGWRGLLVPDLYRLTSNFAVTCMIGGLVWAAWHYPELIYLYRSSGSGNSNAGLYMVVGFVVVMTEMSFAVNWLRLRSGSLWTRGALPCGPQPLCGGDIRSHDHGYWIYQAHHR